jgi:hypothetical protein
MNDLIEFLEREITADEALAAEAKKVTGIDWCAEGPYVTDNYYGDVLHAAWEAVADHAVRHEPVRVLRECAAKRQMIEAVQTCYVGVMALRILAGPYADRPGFRDEWRAA